jgi:hypothetical protein
VDVAGHDFLAGAAFAGDQDRGVGGAIWSASLTTRFIADRGDQRAVVVATAASTAAISSGSGGSGMYSLAPARIGVARRRGVGADAAGDDRHGCARFEPRSARDVEARHRP